MKLRELTGYKSNPLYQKAKEIFQPSIRDIKLDMQLDDFQEFMESQGFKHLGTGSLGIVFEKPGYPWVFKVFKNDPAYLSFIKYARRNQQNQYLPKVRGGIIEINPTTYAVRIEKLTPIDNSTFIKISNVFYTIQDIVADERDEDLEEHERAIIKNYYGLYEFVNAWWNGVFGDVSLDIHAANLMMRGNQPVLSDPVTE